MPVDTPDNEYLKYLPQWTIVRNCIEGEVAIKKAGEAYLPRPSGQTDVDYRIYKDRPKFFDGTARTAEGYFGHIFSKTPTQIGEISEEFELLLKNVDATGNGINEFSQEIVWDSLITGWGGILVDHVRVPEGTTKDKLEHGAFVKYYPAESIINYNHEIINGVKKLTLVVLREDRAMQKPDDEFVFITLERYRVLSFDDKGYIQRVYEKAEDGFKLIEIIEHYFNGKRIDFIPFFSCPSESPDKPLLLGLAYENIGYYQKTADYENGLHFTGVPTPVVENMAQPTREEGGKQIPINVQLGGSRVLFFNGGENKNVNVKYLEFSGAGLGRLKESLDDCLNRMAKLGLQAIGKEKRDAETFETVSLKRAAENGVLSAFAKSMSNKITLAIRFMMRWNGIQEEEADNWSYHLNSEFNSAELSAQILNIMFSARREGEIPRKVWFDQLKQSGKVPEIMTFEEFVEEIERDQTGGHGVDGD